MTPPAAWTTPAAPKKRTDPLVTTAWAELAVGGAFTLAGAIGVGVASRDRDVCGAITGCFSAKVPELDPVRFGAFSLGLGIGVVTSAGITLITTGLRPMRPEESRTNGALATIGHASLSLSVGLFVAGFAYGSVAGHNGREDFSQGWPAFLTGGLLMAAGIPMVVAGTQITDAEERGRKRAVDGHASVELEDLAPTDLRVGPGSAVATWSFR